MPKSLERLTFEEQEAIYQLASSRNVRIPALVEQGALLPALRLPRQTIYAIGHTMVRSAHWEGKQNVKALNEVVSRGERAVIYGDHNSDADHTTFGVALSRTPYRHLVSRIDYAGGLKMLERPQTNFFSRSENVLYVATPKDLDSAEALLAQTPKQSRRYPVVKEYIHNLKELNKASRGTKLRRLNAGQILRFYPQAGRSRDPNCKIGRVPKEVGLYFAEKQTHFFPMLSKGAEQSFPTGGLPKPKPIMLDIKVGEPFTTQQIRQWHRDIEKIDPTIQKADIAMAKLVSLDPSRVADNQIEFYAYVNDLLAQVQSTTRTL